MAKKKASRRGPKPKPPERRLSASIRFMLREDERERIIEAAESAGMQLSEYCRKVLLEDADRRLGPQQ